MSEENRTLTDKFMLRLPDGLRKRISMAARGNGRSMNSEIVDLLETYYPPIPTIDDLVDSIIRTMEALRADIDKPRLRSELDAQLDSLRDWIEFEVKVKEARSKPRHLTSGVPLPDKSAAKNRALDLDAPSPEEEIEREKRYRAAEPKSRRRALDLEPDPKPEGEK